jgi:hypothetical protein
MIFRSLLPETKTEQKILYYKRVRKEDEFESMHICIRTKHSIVSLIK